MTISVDGVKFECGVTHRGINCKGCPDCGECARADCVGVPAIPRSCHKCRNSGKGYPACIACPGPAEESNAGVSIVHYDGVKDPNTFLGSKNRAADLRPAHEPHSLSAAIVGDDAVWRMSEMLYAFTGLSREDLLIVQGLAQGMNMVDIGERLGVSKQYVHLHVVKVMRCYPVLRSLIAIGKRSSGSRKGSKLWRMKNAGCV